ncbi:hypothetical protein NRS6186_22235 (plasmid) [Bacillus subtilis]|uniref:Uncharacterized protein n=3 Tax=Bacteria TaxID=2 RepID=S5DPW2_BACIU|nr:MULTISPECIES: hypothetical protein [Bacillus]MBU8845685.1 hypothetical protein [Alkalicoccobacillus gibsonii]AGQ21248.1 unknown [Bacillus subtilis subsp. subtilis NCIB 3610 = ATCC 6051 = DSM 10]AQZ93161.1 hypothetical protein B4U62_22145 [Bacillus subtilis]AXF35639.1 hypothetical protein DS740_22480 [Bacillus sp. DM2]KNB75949.1 hypothetical protein ACR57_21225 [Bacillus subtilis]
MNVNPIELHQLIIEDLKQQNSILSEQRSTQVAINKLALKRIEELQGTVAQLELKVKNLEEELGKSSKK